MSRKPKDTDYLALSARVRSMERTLLTRSRMERMLQAPTVAESVQVLTELGYASFDAADEAGLNEALADRRAELFEELGRSMPDPAILDVFKLKYDYHNLKVLIKSRGEDPRPLLVNVGRVRADDMAAKYQQTGKWDFLPHTMAAAAAEATRVLAETGDPQLSDFVLDRAYFTEMLSMAQETNCEYLVRYVRTLIDAANLRSFVRARRMHRTGAFLQQVLFEGGSVGIERILSGSVNGAAELYRTTPLREAAEAGDEAIAGGSLTVFEKACDNAVLDQVARARSVPFGVEVVIGYIAARENEFTAARTILSGRMAGLDADTIRERLRDSYV